MLSEYFKLKTKMPEFEKAFYALIDEIKDKRVLVFSFKNVFSNLNKRFYLDKKLSIVDTIYIKYSDETPLKNLFSPSSDKIKKGNFDIILIIDENADFLKNYLISDFNINEENIKTIFKEDINDEIININYCGKYNFSKTLKSHKKKLKNKTVMIYGAGVFFQAIQKYYDLSSINIIGISDKQFETNKPETKFGFKTYKPSEIKDVSPDYTLISTKFYLDIAEDLYFNFLKNTKIKIRPLLSKNFFRLLREVWS